MLSFKSECLNKLIRFRSASGNQGLDNRLITPLTAAANDNAPVARRERLGGLLSFYHRQAA